jgi:hypothetical protein
MSDKETPKPLDFQNEIMKAYANQVLSKAIEEIRKDSEEKIKELQGMSSVVKITEFNRLQTTVDTIIEFRNKAIEILARILKMYGKTTVTDSSGKKVTWLWDYAQDKPRLEHEMTQEEKAASERAKFKGIKGQNI